MTTSSLHGENTIFHTNQANDPEKAVDQNEVSQPKSKFSKALRHAFNRALSASPVEIRGVLPVPLEERTSTQYSSYFSIWACMNINLLPYVCR